MWGVLLTLRPSPDLWKGKVGGQALPSWVLRPVVIAALLLAAQDSDKAESELADSPKGRAAVVVAAGRR